MSGVPSPRLYLLGPPRFERDDQPVELTAAKAVAILGYLAARHEPQPRERLVGLLWAESSDDAARKNLRNALWSIRKSLGDEVLIAEADRLSLNDAVWVDVRAFEEISDHGTSRAASDQRVSPWDKVPDRREWGASKNLQSAIPLFRGPLLDGLVLTEAREFELWLTGERERLAQSYLRVLSTLVEQFRAEGHWAEVIAVAQRALKHDNLQEPMYRALMEAHARLGERVQGVHQYDRLRETLERELGVRPLPETEALYAAITTGEISQPARAVPAPPGHGRRQPAQREPRRPPYIGHRAELAALGAELHAVADGSARVVLITGEIGIGKSRLWREWSLNLPANLTVLETRCLDSMQALPFAPLTDLFSRAAVMEKIFTKRSAVLPIWLAEVARLLPEIRVRLPDLPAPAALPPDEERRRVFEAFAQCLLALEGRPLVLFVDDLHWADHATLEWLAYLVHRLRHQPLLLVAAYRPEDAPAPLVHQVASWAREGVTRRLPLARLTPEECALLITALGGDPALAERAKSESAGNPYFLIELYRSAPGDIPPVLNELLRARLNALPDGARQVLQAAAVLEPGFDFVTLRRTSGRGEEETLEALDTLANVNLLVERDGGYDFAHPLVASVVREGLGGARRAFLHRRAGEALEAAYQGRPAKGAQDLRQIAGQLARHYAQAHDAARAAHYSEMAAERALALASPAEAEAWYRQAIALDPTPARQIGLGEALQQQADFPSARGAFHTALREFEAKGERRGEARACLNLAETYLGTGQAEEVIRWAEKSLTYVHTGSDPEAHALAHFLLGAGRLQTGQTLAQAELDLSEATRLANENHLPGTAARSRFELGNLLAERGDLPNALQAYRDSIALAQKAGDQFQEVLGHNNLAYHAMLAGDLAAAREHIEIALNLSEARAFHLPRQYLYSTRGEIALAEKQWDEAEQWFKRGLAEAERNENRKQAANYRANLGLAARGRGDLDSALILLEEARESVATMLAPHLQTQVDLWLAEIFLQRGERAAFEEALARAETRLEGSGREQLREWAARSRGAV
jgi:DNA-binding SARP family transcriptional activator